MPDLDQPGARVTPFPASFAARVGEAVRYAITGVTPTTWFGPLQPLKPMAPEGAGGRRWDYPVGYNLQYQPRTDEPFSFATLRGLAETCDMLRLVIETRKDQIEAQSWDVRPRKRADGTHPKAGDFAADIAAAKEFFAAPDREHDLAGWLRLIAEEMFVTDAVSLFVRPDRGGRVFAFEAIDGATIAPRIDAWGRTPVPPDVAYQQILHGVPAADFSTDQLVYFPRNRRPGHVYGYSPVEQVITTANILIRRSAHQLSYYTDGNLIDAMLVGPANMSMDQLKSWQDYWDSVYAGNLQMRRRGVWVPGGSDVKPLKQPALKDGYDEFLARIICFAFSISPQPFVSMMNRATAETAHDAALEEGLMPVLRYFERLFRLLFDRMGWRDIEMVAIDDRETDPKTADDIDVADVKAGIRTINEVRAARGLDPVAGGDAPMLATASGYVPLSGAAHQANTSGKSLRPSLSEANDPLRKDFNPDLHPRWPARAPDSEGGRFAPKGNGDPAQEAYAEAPHSPADDSSAELEDAAYQAETVIDLRQEEARGGHTIAVHIGKDPAYLLKRIRTERIDIGDETIGLKRAGSFSSLEAANKLVNSTLAQNAATVSMVASGSLNDAFVESRFRSPTGYEAFAPNDTAQARMRTTYGVGVYIEHDRKSPNGFTVYTAYPRED